MRVFLFWISIPDLCVVKHRDFVRNRSRLHLQYCWYPATIFHPFLIEFNLSTTIKQSSITLAVLHNFFMANRARIHLSNFSKICFYIIWIIYCLTSSIPFVGPAPWMTPPGMWPTPRQPQPWEWSSRPPHAPPQKPRPLRPCCCPPCRSRGGISPRRRGRTAGGREGGWPSLGRI